MAKRSHAARLFAAGRGRFVDRKEETAIGADGQEAWIGRGRRQPEWGQGAGLFVKPKRIDTLARRARVGADEDKASGGLCGRRQQHDAQDHSNEPERTRAHVNPECSRKIRHSPMKTRATAPRHDAGCRGTIAPASVTIARPAVGEADKFSPLGYYDLLAYEQAFPGEPGQSLGPAGDGGEVLGVPGVALRRRPASSIWTSLGPLTRLTTSAGKRLRPRVGARDFARAVELDGPCRLWVGTAGGGVWRPTTR